MIELAFEGLVALLRMDRPASRNAFDGQGWDRLAVLAAAAARSDARVLVLHGAPGGAFSAGADLGEVAALADNPALRAGFRLRMRTALDALHALPIPTIAAVDGACFGAGVALALACDIRIAGSRARFAVTPAKLGIGYPKQDVDRLIEEVGRAQAARLLFGAEPIDALEALRIGLAQLEAPEAITAANNLAEIIAGNAPSSIAYFKAMLTGVERNWDAAFDEAFEGEDFREGMRAFKERRPSRY